MRLFRGVTGGGQRFRFDIRQSSIVDGKSVNEIVEEIAFSLAGTKEQRKITFADGPRIWSICLLQHAIDIEKSYIFVRYCRQVIAVPRVHGD